MNNKVRVAAALLVGVLAVAAMSGPTSAATNIPVHCEQGASLQAAINAAAPGRTLEVSGTCDGSFVIAKNLNLMALGGATLDGNNAGPVVIVMPGATAKITGFTIAHGLGTDYVVNGENFPVAGGVTNFGNLTLTKSVVRDNTGQSPGGVASWAGTSGLPVGTLKINASTISGNTGGTAGGIFSGPGVGTLTVTNTSVTGNTGISVGGISVYGLLILFKTTVTGNNGTGPYGAGGIGMPSRSTHLTMTSGTVSGNSPCDICQA